MSTNRIKKYQNRRIMTDEGWKYFCNQCGDYKIESDFYNSKHTPFGITYKCKEHFRYEEKTEKDTEHLKLNPITDSDLDETKVVLMRLGYEFGPDKPPVWEQFNTKHNIK